MDPAKLLKSKQIPAVSETGMKTCDGNTEDYKKFFNLKSSKAFLET